MSQNIKESVNMIKAEVAVYPLKSDNVTKTINDSIDTLKSTKVNYKVNSMNTVLTGNRDEVFDCLKNMFTEAEKNGGELNMVVTLGNSQE